MGKKLRHFSYVQRMAVAVLVLFFVFALPMQVKKTAAAETRGNFHALILNGTNSATNTADQLAKYVRMTKLPNYQVNISNIHDYFWNCDSDNFTISEIDKRLDNAFQNNRDEDLSLFYYSGHTYSYSKNENTYYGIPSGVKYATLDSAEKYIYKYSDIVEKLNRYKGHFILIIDACFAERAYTEGVRRLNATGKFTCLLSCGISGVVQGRMGTAKGNREGKQREGKVEEQQHESGEGQFIRKSNGKRSRVSYDHRDAFFQVL